MSAPSRPIFEGAPRLVPTLALAWSHLDGYLALEHLGKEENLGHD